MADGMHVYDNPVGVLTNNPPFPYQMAALNNYRGLSTKQPENTFAPGVELSAYSRGMGGLGLPGDYHRSHALYVWHSQSKTPNRMTVRMQV